MNTITFAIGPGEEQILWDNTDGVVNKFYLHPLKIQADGELIYIGTSLHDLMGKKNTEDADYSIRLRTMGTDDLQLDIRARRQDASNFVALKVDFSTDTIRLVETIAGVETNLDSASHDLKFHGIIKYDFELVMTGSFLYGLVNGYNIVSASTESFRTEPGLSLSFPTFNADDPPIIDDIYVTETKTYPDPMPLLSDPGDLLRTWRLSIKSDIENPSVRTWDSYVKAVKLYEQRSAGISENTWEELGYYIKSPKTEEWFGNLPSG